MRILVDSGDFVGSNLGDVAMLQVAVRRLRTMWRDASIKVLSENKDALAIHCPGTKAVAESGRRAWFADGDLFGRVHSVLPVTVSRQVFRIQDAFRQRWPRSFAWVLQTKMQMRNNGAIGLRDFLSAMDEADLLIVSGAGGLTDHARPWAFEILNTIEMATRRGVPTALLGQGIGPIEDPELIAKARVVLPSVNFIAIREDRAGLSLLESLGVPLDRIMTTGDDAIELAYEKRPSTLGKALGVNLRVQPSSGVKESVIERVRPALHEAARSFEAPLRPIPISIGSAYNDSETIRGILKGYDDSSDGGKSIDTSFKVIKEVGHCRVVVTGAYHAAVFALAQGIPVVCLAKSQYFLDKFYGLGDQFGAGCEVISLEDSDFKQRLKGAIRSAWKSAEEVRESLLSSASRQVELSRCAYRRVKELTDHRIIYEQEHNV